MTATTLDVESRLRAAQALLSGHFQLSSGRHSDRYVQCALLLARPVDAEAMGAALAERLREARADVVVGPALGGVIIAHEVARALGVRCFFAERKDGVMSLRRGFAVEPGMRAVVVEDVVTTGGSANEVVALLRELGAEVVAVGSIVQRSASNPFDVRYEALLPLEVTSWPPEECPLCAQGLPAVKPGSRPGGAAAGESRRA